MCPFGPEQMQRQQKAQRNTVARQTQRNLPFFNAQLNMEEQQIDYYSPTSIDGYRGLLDKLKDLQPDGIEIAEPVQDENVGFKERRNREKQRAQQLEQQKEQYKILGKTPGLLRFKDVASLNLLRSNDGKKTWMQEKLPHSQLTRQETLRNILDENDYSNFENLDSVMRNVVASSALSKFIQEYNVTEESDPETLCKEIQERTEGVSGLLNPALRLALSLAQRTPGISDEMKQIFHRLDEAMSTAVMVATLTHEPDQSKVEQYFRNKGEENPSQRAKEAVVANRAQQIQIAKRLLLMQLSNFQKINDKNGGDEPWDKSMAVALSHCSRVALTLPRQEDGEYNTKEDHKNMWQDNYKKIMSMLAGGKMTKEQWREFRSVTGIQFFSADRKNFAWQWKG